MTRARVSRGAAGRIVVAALAVAILAGLWRLAATEETRASVAGARAEPIEGPPTRYATALAEAPARESRVAVEGEALAAGPEAVPAAHATFRIRAVHGGLALGDATIWCEHATADRLGVTGADGVLELAEAPPSGTLTARHGVGLVGEREWNPDDGFALPYEITIELAAGRRRVGHVVHEETGEPFGDVLVLARAQRSSRSAPLALPRAFWEQPLSPGVGAWTRADAGGRFVLDGLLEERSYQLLAVGRGHASATRAPSDGDDDADLCLAVLPFFGARFVLADGPSGVALPAAVLGGYQSSLTIDADQRDVGHYRGGAAVDYLLAESGTLHARANTDAWREVFVRAPEPATGEFPVLVYASAPGYARLEAQSALRRLDRGPVEERVALTPTAALGRVRLRFDGLEADATAMRQIGGLGHFSLASPAVPDGSFDFTVWSVSGPVVEFVVPAGRYRYDFTGSGRPVKAPAAGEDGVIEVPTGDTLELVIPWPAPRATIEVDLTDSGGRPYHGFESLSYAPASRVQLDAEGNVVAMAMSQTILPSPPYLLVDVPPGRTYVLAGFDMSKGTWIDVPESGTVRVALTAHRP